MDLPEVYADIIAEETNAIVKSTRRLMACCEEVTDGESRKMVLVDRRYRIVIDQEEPEAEPEDDEVVPSFGDVVRDNEHEAEIDTFYDLVGQLGNVAVEDMRDFIGSRCSIHGLEELNEALRQTLEQHETQNYTEDCQGRLDQE